MQLTIITINYNNATGLQKTMESVLSCFITLMVFGLTTKDAEYQPISLLF